MSSVMQGQSETLVGSVVAGRYRVLRLVGAGGMGQVFLAEHEAIEKKLALKVLRPEHSARPDLVTRFQQEAISASRIKHPNVLDVFDFGQLENGCFYLAMEYLEGHDLADDLSAHAVVEPARAVRLTIDICRALAAAHARGVVHRDLKPENIFLCPNPDGELVKIVDFGIAQLRSTTADNEQQARHTRRRLTRTGMIFGTPEYMAPEQAAGKRSDLRVDIYSLGIILYEMLCGGVPHTAETFMGVLNSHLHDPTPELRSINPDLQISEELEQAVMRALCKDPERRYQSMSEFAQSLRVTPEGSQSERGKRMESIPDVTARDFVPAGGQTLAQFPGRGADVEAPTQLLEDFKAASQEAVHPVSSAQTQLGAEPSGAPRLSNGSRLGILAAGAAVLLVGVGLYKWAQTPVAASSSPLSSAEPVSVPSAEPPSAPASASAAPSRVVLTVNSKPPGAVVTRDGFQVCDTTPCEVQVEPGAKLELEARKGAQRGSTKVLAQSDQQVLIELGAARAVPPTPSKTCLKEVEEDGIKVVKRVPCR